MAGNTLPAQRVRVTEKPVKCRQVRKTMKRILLALLAAIVLSSAVTGCRTARGAGEDLEKAGQKIQDKADEHTPP
jgi:predicted small secreted protein